MQIPLSDALVPEWMVLKSMLPEGYGATKTGSYYLVSTSAYIVAKAIVGEFGVEFEFVPGPKGEEFKNTLYAKHPKYDPNRGVWVVFYEWCGAYTFVGHGMGHDTPDEALAFVKASHIERGALLCLVRLSDLFSEERGDDFMTVSAFPVNMDLTLGSDLGPTRITITHLESTNE